MVKVTMLTGDRLGREGVGTRQWLGLFFNSPKIKKKIESYTRKKLYFAENYWLMSDLKVTHWPTNWLTNNYPPD